MNSRHRPPTFVTDCLLTTATDRFGDAAFASPVVARRLLAYPTGLSLALPLLPAPTAPKLPNLSSTAALAAADSGCDCRCRRAPSASSSTDSCSVDICVESNKTFFIVVFHAIFAGGGGGGGGEFTTMSAMFGRGGHRS